MAKADLSRDYYGDLGLQPGAEITEIKKQFKKLGRKLFSDCPRLSANPKT